MAHQPTGQHWRDMGKSKSADLPDQSTKEILDKLHTPRTRDVVEAHAGVQSVNTDSGMKPTASYDDAECDCDPDDPDCECDDDANEIFNQAAKGPNYRPNVVEVKGK